MQVSDRVSGSTPSSEEALRARVAELEARLAEREAAIEALRQTHQVTAAVLEQAGALFFAVDREWRCTHVNTPAAALFGQPSEQLLQQTLWEACPQLLGTIWEQRFRQAMAEQVSVRFEALSVRDRRWYDVAVHPSLQGLSVHAVETTERRQQETLLHLQAQMLDEIQDAVIAVDDEERVVYLVTTKTGEVVPSAWSNIRLSDDTLVGIGLDLRERRRQEAALQAASAQMERILSSISDSFAVLDREGTYRYVNDRAAEIAGMTKEAILGKRVWDLFPATRGSEFERQTQRAWEEQRPIRFEYYSPDLDCWLEHHLYPSAEELTFLTADITAQKRAEEAVRQVHQEMATTLGRVSDIFLSVNQEWRLTYCNQQALDACGWHSEEPVGHSLWDLCEFWRGTTFETTCRTAVARQEEAAFEFLHPQQETWYRVSLYPDPTGLSVFMQNITERKQVEEALRESEERFRLASSAARIGVYSRNLRTGQDYWSPEFLSIYGVKPGRPLPLREGIPAAVHPEDRARVLAEAHARLRRAAAPEFASEHRLLLPDGEVRWVMIRGRVEFDAHDQPIASHGLVMDITERKRAEEALRQSEERFRVALKHAPITLAQIDRDLRYIWMHNPHPDFQPEAIIGKEVGELHPTEQTLSVKRLIQQVLVSGTGLHREYHNDLSDGRRYFDLTVEPLHNEAGEVVGVTVATLDITPHRRLAEALRESEERFRVALSNSPIMVCTTDRDLRYTWIHNPHAGFTVEQVLGKRDDELLPAEEAAELISLKQQVLDQEAGARRTLAVRVGEQVDHYDLTVEPLRDAAGQLVGLTAAAAQVTEMVRLQQECEEAYALLDALFASAPTGLAVCDSDLRFVRINQTLAGINGLPPEAHLGKRLSELLPEHESASQIEQAWRHILATGEARIGVEVADLITPPVPNYWLATWFPIHLRDEIIGIGTLVEDITARKLAEDALRAREQQFSTLANAIPQLAWMTDADGWIFWYNQRWYDYTGTTLDEVKGWGWQRVHHPDHVDRMVARFKHCFAAREPWEDTFPLRGKDGDYRWFLSRALPIQDEQGRVVRWFGTNTDITENLRLEQTLRELTATLEARVQERTREVQELAARLALAEHQERTRIAHILHDHIQQLLYGMQIRRQMLELDAPSGDLEAVGSHLAELKDLIQEAIRALRTLTVELSPPVLQSEDFVDAVGWLGDHMRQVYALSVEIEAHDCSVDDKNLRVLLFQALRELLFNVVKHAGVNRASVRLQCEDGQLTATVSDAGTGFDAQLEEMPDDQPTGFGLSSIRERIRLFGGRFTIQSVPGAGTQASIVLPLEHGP